MFKMDLNLNLLLHCTQQSSLINLCVSSLPANLRPPLFILYFLFKKGSSRLLARLSVGQLSTNLFAGQALAAMCSVDLDQLAILKRFPGIFY